VVEDFAQKWNSQETSTIELTSCRVGEVHFINSCFEFQAAIWHCLNHYAYPDAIFLAERLYAEGKFHDIYANCYLLLVTVSRTVVVLIGHVISESFSYIGQLGYIIWNNLITSSQCNDHILEPTSPASQHT
jgi:hypothetical protein